MQNERPGWLVRQHRKRRTTSKARWLLWKQEEEEEGKEEEEEAIEPGLNNHNLNRKEKSNDKEKMQTAHARPEHATAWLISRNRVENWQR